MKTLDELMVLHQSDKASQFSRTYAQPHNYCVHLERFLNPIRDAEIKLVEIGTGGGESMRCWLDFFPNAQVFGVDLVSNTNSWNTPGVKPHDRYTFSCGNQADPKFWKKFVETYGNFDVVMDDGAHVGPFMITTFKCLWPHVKSGGIYEVEDLGVAPLAAHFFQAFATDANVGNTDIDSIYFAKELCILRKK